MSLTIYQLEHSPYCIPITQALKALNIPFAERNVSNADRREIIELTNGAYYQVPVLQHGDNVIFEHSGDSLDVARYVDVTFAKGRLFPVPLEGLQRILLNTIENDVEGITFRLVDPFYVKGIEDIVERTAIIRHKERKFGLGCLESWTQERESHLAEATRLLLPFDLILQNRAFLLDEEPVFSDFALFGIIGNMTYRDYNSIPENLSAFIGWYARMKAFRYR